MRFQPYLINWPSQMHVQLVVHDTELSASYNFLVADSTYMHTGNNEIDRILKSYPSLTAYAYKSKFRVKKEAEPHEGPHISETRTPLRRSECRILRHFFRETEVVGDSNKQTLVHEMKLFLDQLVDTKNIQSMYYFLNEESEFSPIDMKTRLHNLEKQQRSSSKEA